MFIDQECGNYMYECWYCGDPVLSTTSTPILRIFCDGCKERYEAEREEIKREYIRLKTEMMYERALRTLEKQQCSLAHYKEAAEAVYGLASEDPEKFQSTPEMLAAMELIRNKIRIKMQYKIYRHSIDILIPEFKVALEVDGYNHRFKVLKDSHRDVQLVQELGRGWEVIRIPTRYIEGNLRQLIPAIKELYNEKQELRRKHNGFIPCNFSERDAELQRKYDEESKVFRKDM